MLTDDRFFSEPYEVVTSDNRRFIVEAADPETIRRNFPVAGESLKIISVKPLISHGDRLTVHELAEALSTDGHPGPKWQTLLLWARLGRIPSERIGKKYVRFVERDVRKAMASKMNGGPK
jgi:hypothetical protein